MGVATPLQRMVLALVLIAAVWVDMAYRRVRLDMTPLVEFRNIVKTFGGVHAVENVSLELGEGEVLGLLGHNGAGKSTLIKILSGVFTADSGEIRFAGRPVEIRSTRDAKSLGIETIYQTLALSENLDAVANLFLGRELTGRFGFMHEEAMEGRPGRTLQRLRLRLPHLSNLVASLSGGQRQAVAIARAIHFNAKFSSWTSRPLRSDPRRRKRSARSFLSFRAKASASS